MKKISHDAPVDQHSLIIPVFIMNSGCPHRCVFCNQKISAGNHPATITKELLDTEVTSYLNWHKNKAGKVEIAFYGGNFTGIDPESQEELLALANAFVRKGVVNAIRISTRPDYVDQEKLSLLKQYNVSTVEIGAESFVDDVLSRAQRGHNAADIENAVTLLKKNGFETGLHLMAGLPGDTPEGFDYSLNKTIELHPDTVRLHPVIIFSGTALAEDFNQGKYSPLDIEEAVSLCSRAWEKLSAAGMRIIRMGVQMTPEMQQNGAVLAGPVHPAFGSLVLSAVFLRNMISALEKISRDSRDIIFYISERDVSSFRGLKNMNIQAIKKLYPGARLIVESSPNRPRGEIVVTNDLEEVAGLKIPGML